MSESIPKTTIFYDPDTACYGFATRYPDRRVHHMIHTFNSVGDVLAWCDPHRERIWEERSAIGLLGALGQNPAQIS